MSITLIRFLDSFYADKFGEKCHYLFSLRREELPDLIYNTSMSGLIKSIISQYLENIFDHKTLDETNIDKSPQNFYNLY